MTDRRLTCREVLEWLEEAETLSLRLQAAREKLAAQGGAPPPRATAPPETGPAATPVSPDAR